MQLREFFGVLVASWRTVIAVLLLVVGAATLGTLRIEPSYSTTARFYFSTVAPAQDANNRGLYVLTAADLNTFAEVLTAPVVLEPLRTQAKVPSGQAVTVTARVPETINVLDVTATAGSGQLAAALANSSGEVLAREASKFAPLLVASGSDVRAIPLIPATTPLTPTSPNIPRNLLMALLAGLGLGIGIALLRHSLDTKLRTSEDIRALVDRPVLADLPRTTTLADAPLPVESAPFGVYAEAIRRLRTNLMFVDVTSGKHSFVVSSAMPGEGKTSTAVNLGRAMADSGMRVLLIDADLRKPNVANHLGLDGGVGLTTILLGRARPVEVIQEWPGTTFHVLPSGDLPPNPTELLGSARFEELLAELSSQYDFVLIDSPPLLPVIDTVVLQRLTGGVVLVVAAGRTRKREFSTALASLRTAGVEPAGIVRTFVELMAGESDRYGSYYRSDRNSKSGVAPRESARKRPEPAKARQPRRRSRVEQS